MSKNVSTETADSVETKHGVSRRDFVKTSSAVVAGSALISCKAVPRAYARGSDTIKVGVVGCGGRGTGAAGQALSADDGVVIWSMGDAFPDRLKRSKKNLVEHASDRVKVPAERSFTGFDAYKNVIDSGVDVVILATPPHFRPEHLAASVNAGKHVFCEKPMAVDGPGVRSVIDSVQKAKDNNTNLMSGFCWRYSLPERETYRRIHDGAIGDVQCVHTTYHTGTLGKQSRKPEWSDTEWQMRNWWHFNWLSGDHIVEQSCHSVDKINWAMQNQTPLRATGLGGREAREGPESGNVFDHFAVIYEYPSGARCFNTCRQMPRCSNDNSDYIYGSKGTCMVNGWAPKHVITGQNEWSYEGPTANMYQVEHNELMKAIRTGDVINDGDFMTQSTMMSIIGRMAAYTGQTVEWDDAMNSTERLGPTEYGWNELEVVPVPVPGRSRVI